VYIEEASESDTMSNTRGGYSDQYLERKGAFPPEPVIHEYLPENGENGRIFISRVNQRAQNRRSDEELLAENESMQSQSYGADENER